MVALSTHTVDIFASAQQATDWRDCERVLTPELWFYGPEASEKCTAGSLKSNKPSRTIVLGAAAPSPPTHSRHLETSRELKIHQKVTPSQIKKLSEYDACCLSVAGRCVGSEPKTIVLEGLLDWSGPAVLFSDASGP